MDDSIAVVGAGIAGLCTSLALAKSGHSVVIYERDIAPPDGGADEAFFEWKRRGAAQFRHPHAFLAVMCNMLEKNYPDLIEEFWKAGARKVSFEEMVPPELKAEYAPEPGDDAMWLLMCRRATMETVLRRYVESQPNISINNTTEVTGVTTASDATGILSVSGLLVRHNRSETQTVAHSIVVDASGRTTRFPGWLEAEGATIPVEDDNAEIVYYTRHYKLREGAVEPPRHGKDRSAGDLGYIKYGVFPGDNGHFAVIVCVPDQETELREAIKDGDTYDAICCEIPGLEPWVNKETSEPTTVSFGFGDIHAVWKHFVNEGKPAALNYFAVGDAAVRTNPLYGRGCSTGIIHAHLLADVIHQETDPLQRALKFDERTEEELRPIFATSLREDKSGIRRAAAIREGRELDKTDTLKKWFSAAFGDAISAASREQLHVMRGVMRTFNLMEKPGDFLKDNRTRWTVLRYMLRGRARNSRSRLQRGPKRDEMLTIIRDRQKPGQQEAA